MFMYPAAVLPHFFLTNSATWDRDRSAQPLRFCVSTGRRTHFDGVFNPGYTFENALGEFCSY